MTTRVTSCATCSTSGSCRVRVRAAGCCAPSTFRAFRPARCPTWRCYSAAGEDPAASPAAPTTPPPTPAPVTLQSASAELLNGTFWNEAKAQFPAVPWGPEEVLKIMLSGIALVGVAAGVSAVNGGGSSAPAGFHEQALQHLQAEVGLAVLMPGLLWTALGQFHPQQAGLFQLRPDAGLAGQALLLCAVVFPLVDPLLYSLWCHVIEPVAGAPVASSYVDALRQATDAADLPALAAQFAASCALTPFWEEVFWRGFLLVSFTKVLPLPLALGFSSANFAMMHLSAHNFLPLLALSACCDLLYLRTANLLPSIVFHAAWNAYQLIAICALHKPEFV